MVRSSFMMSLNTPALPLKCSCTCLRPSTGADNPKIHSTCRGHVTKAKGIKQKTNASLIFIFILCVSIFCALQRLSGSHKALVEMQDDVAELLRSATRDYANTKVCVGVVVPAVLLGFLKPACITPFVVSAGESWTNPVCSEFYWGGSASADCSGGLSQPSHGELFFFFCLADQSPPVSILMLLFLCVLILPGLRPGVNRAVLWRGGGAHLPGSLLFCHRSDVFLYCVQCATHLAQQEVTQANVTPSSRTNCHQCGVAQLNSIFENRTRFFRCCLETFLMAMRTFHRDSRKVSHW